MEQLDPQSPRFECIRSTDFQGDPLLELHGELDMSSATEFRQSIEELISAGVTRVVFDLKDLVFMDSSGIAVLVFAANSISSVEVRNSSSIIKRIVEATGLTGFLRLDP
ncbi:MAG: STAS domain-containing protein [Acidimicrobiales bacterium]